MWYNENWIIYWQFPDGCSRCKTTRAKNKWLLKGDHMRMNGRPGIVRNYRKYKYSIEVPVCDGCHGALSKPSLKQKARPLWPFAYFRRNGKQIDLVNKLYQGRFSKN